MARFGVEVNGDKVSYLGQTQQLASCYASVETAGQVRDRATLTRVAGGALVAGPVGAVVGGLLRKRVDERECYLLVTGTVDWVIPIRPSMAPMARTFAASLNSQARARAQHEAELEVARAEGAAQKAAMEARRVGVYRGSAELASARPAPESPHVLRRSRSELRERLGL